MAPAALRARAPVSRRPPTRRSIAMRNIPVMLGALCAISICGSTFAAGKADRIDQRSLWSGGGDLSSCQTRPDDAGKRSCLIVLMRLHGASPQAIEFARDYKDLAYISKFTAYG